jgi:hypothetical protein
MEDNKQPRNSQRKTDVCVSAILTDGTIIETIFDRSREATSFALWKENEVKKIASIESKETRLIPYSPRNNLLRHGIVRLPSDIGRYESKSALVDEVRAFIRRYCDLDEDAETVATHYVLFTWIYDAFSELPYLRVRAEIGSGKTRFLHTVGSLCYKSIFVSGGSTVSPIFRILDVFRGTLVLDEADFQHTDERGLIVKLLNNGHADGFPMLRSETNKNNEFSPRAFHIFGPKIIASRRAFADRALESRCITFDLSARRPRSDIPLNLPASFQDEATALQNKLLAFRFAERFKPRDITAAADDLEVESRVSQVFAPLLATIDDETAAARIRAIACESNRIILAERQHSPEALVLDVIRGLLNAGEALYLKVIAANFARRHGQEYRMVITPRWIGRVLRSSLHIVPTKSNGNFLIRREEQPRLRKLFERYGLLEVDRDQEKAADTGETALP